MFPQGWCRLQTFKDTFVWSIFNSYHSIHIPFRQPKLFFLSSNGLVTFWQFNFLETM